MDITTVTYNGVLKIGEEQMFRGALLKKLGGNADILLHNHLGNRLRYSYPLVQYKVIAGKPAVIGVEKGSAILTTLPRRCKLMIGKSLREFVLNSFNTERYEPEISDVPKMYSISRYVPLNSDNMVEYEGLPALTDKICLLESIISANVLAFFKGIEYHCSAQIQTAISSMDKTYKLYYKGVGFQAFDVKFITNVLLPDGIGLGKSSSLGLGTIKRLPIPERFKKRLCSPIE